MLKINKVHHVAIIASNYEKSKHFYTQILGLQVIREVYREARDSYKLDLAIGENYVIELFSFPNPPARPSRPESCGLRHLAKSTIEAKGIEVEAIRIDEFTGKKFTFFADPDDLPIEFYEQ
jgi:glyoxylase I family protein